MSSLVHSKVSPEFWHNCSICHDQLDGTESEDHSAMVSISKRCLHVFHDTCIKEWIKRDNRCPECRLDYFEEWEVLPNPEYSQEYKKWKDDSEHYSFEKSFQEKYSTEEELREINPQEVVKPRSLMGKKQIRELTTEVVWEHFGKNNEKVRGLKKDASKEEVSKAIQSAFKFQEEALNILRQSTNVLLENDKKQSEEIQEIRASNREIKQGFSEVSHKLNDIEEDFKSAKHRIKELKLDTTFNSVEEIKNEIQQIKKENKEEIKKIREEFGLKKVEKLPIESDLETIEEILEEPIHAEEENPLIAKEPPKEPKPKSWKDTAIKVGTGLGFGAIGVGLYAVAPKEVREAVSEAGKSAMSTAKEVPNEAVLTAVSEGAKAVAEEGMNTVSSVFFSAVDLVLQSSP